ncbi:hypothetical protein GCM10022221_69160 [Actinocorallia aurea]
MATAVALQTAVAVIGFLGVVGLLLLVLDRAPLRRRGTALALLAPALVLLAVGTVLPAARTVLLSFQDSGGRTWAGPANYVWLLTGPGAGTLPRTLVWVVAVPAVVTVIGLLYAVAADGSRFEAAAKTLMFLPMALSFVAAGVIWKLVYAYRPEDFPQTGLLNGIVTALGGAPRPWLLDAPWNTILLAAVLVWAQTGFATVVLSAAIKGVPAELVEAARLEGASARQVLRRVTLPWIRPAVVLVVVSQAIGTLKLFDLVRTMTGGRFGTGVVATEMYDQAFRYGESGRGSALAVFLFAMAAPAALYLARARKAGVR